MKKEEGIKNLLKNYTFFTAMIPYAESNIEIIEYKLEGVSSIRFDKQHGSTNQAFIEEKKHEMREELALYESLKDCCEDSIILIGKILNKLTPEERNIISSVYMMETDKLEDICKGKEITPSGLYKQITKTIEEIL